MHPASRTTPSEQVPIPNSSAPQQKAPLEEAHNRIQSLEAEICQAKLQIQRLEMERESFRRIAYAALRDSYSKNDWEGFDPGEFCFSPEEVRAHAIEATKI